MISSTIDGAVNQRNRNDADIWDTDRVSQPSDTTERLVWPWENRWPVTDPLVAGEGRTFAATRLLLGEPVALTVAGSGVAATTGCPWSGGLRTRRGTRTRTCRLLAARSGRCATQRCGQPRPSGGSSLLILVLRARSRLTVCWATPRVPPICSRDSSSARLSPDGRWRSKKANPLTPSRDISRPVQIRATSGIETASATASIRRRGT